MEVAWLGVHSAFVRPRKILEKKASAGEAARLSTTETLVRLQSAWLPFLSLPLVYRLSNSSGTAVLALASTEIYSRQLHYSREYRMGLYGGDGYLLNVIYNL